MTTDKKPYLHMLIILDRSGSMNEMADDAIGGVNTLVSTQAKEPGDCTVTLVQFDNEYEEVYTLLPASDAPPRNSGNFLPRGGTALFDAIGKALANEKQRLADQMKNDGPVPDLVAVHIVTDGHENSSREWKREQVKDLLDQVQNKDKWSVNFLGQGKEVALEGKNLGISNVASYARGNVGAAFASTSHSTTRMREARSRGLDLETAVEDAKFTAGELNFMDPGASGVGEVPGNGPGEVLKEVPSALAKMTGRLSWNKKVDDGK